MSPNIIKPLYIIIGSAKGYIKESNGNKYLILVHSAKNRIALEKHEKIWSKNKDFIRSASKNLNNRNEKSMKSDSIQMIIYCLTKH